MSRSSLSLRLVQIDYDDEQLYISWFGNSSLWPPSLQKPALRFDVCNLSNNLSYLLWPNDGPLVVCRNVFCIYCKKTKNKLCGFLVVLGGSHWVNNLENWSENNRLMRMCCCRLTNKSTVDLYVPAKMWLHFSKLSRTIDFRVFTKIVEHRLWHQN